MGKVFNAAADCKPQLHYMVDISGRIEEIKQDRKSTRLNSSHWS